MGYVIPALDELIEQIETIRQEYTKQRVAPNPDRLALLDTLDAVKKCLLGVQSSTDRLTPEAAQSVMLGAYLYCLEMIAAESRFADPQFKEGYFYNSGSKLYLLLLNHLHINSQNPILESERLIHLSHFYQFFKDNELTLDADLNDAAKVRENIKGTIKTVFRHNYKDVTNAIKSIPAESTLDTSMNNMNAEYQRLTHADNSERRFYAKLVKAMSTVSPARESDQHHKHFMSRRQRIKMGFLLYIMQEIWDSYYLRSPKGNSALYDLCRQAMNIEQMTDIDEHTRVACLSAFETFITDNKCVSHLEETMGKIYLDPKLRVMRKKVNNMIEAIRPSFPPENAPISGFAWSCATLGAMIAAAPGYGTGYVIGYTLSQIDTMVDAKLAVTTLTDYSMTVIFGKAGGYLGYYAANMVVDATLERGFAKVFEALGMLTGAATGGLIGLVIYDLSYKTLRSLCQLHNDLHKQLSPNLAKDLDPGYIECLLELPNDIFPVDQKRRLSGITDQGLFSVNQSSDYEPLLQSSQQERHLTMSLSESL